MIKGVECTAAFGRLCVETVYGQKLPDTAGQPPSGGCVLKRVVAMDIRRPITSRLRAAVC